MSPPLQNEITLRFLKFLSDESWWTLLCQFLLYNKVTRAYTHIPSFSHIIFHPGLSQETGQSSLCGTAGPLCSSILSVLVGISWPHTWRVNSEKWENAETKKNSQERIIILVHSTKSSPFILPPGLWRIFWAVSLSCFAGAKAPARWKKWAVCCPPPGRPQTGWSQKVDDADSQWPHRPPARRVSPSWSPPEPLSLALSLTTFPWRQSDWAKMSSFSLKLRL